MTRDWRGRSIVECIEKGRAPFFAAAVVVLPQRTGRSVIAAQRRLLHRCVRLRTRSHLPIQSRWFVRHVRRVHSRT